MSFKLKSKFSNFGIKNPVERSINNICKLIHKSVKNALNNMELTVKINEIIIKHDVPGVIGHSDNYKYNTKCTMERCEKELKTEASDFYKLAKVALEKYNEVIKESGYKFHLSELEYEATAYRQNDRWYTDAIVAFQFIGIFRSTIILDDTTSQKDVDKLISNMYKKDW